MGLPYGEEIMIVGRTMWTQSTSVTDGQTDGQTDRFTITKTALCIVLRGKNQSKYVFQHIRQCLLRSLGGYNYTVKLYFHFEESMLTSLSFSFRVPFSSEDFNSSSCNREYTGWAKKLDHF